jgi:hypothetical protein
MEMAKPNERGIKMNTKSIIIFVGGAAVGALTTYKLIKDKYEKFAQDEIDSVLDYNRRRRANVERALEKSEKREPVSEMTDEQYEKRYKNVVRKNHYNPDIRPRGRDFDEPDPDDGNGEEELRQQTMAFNVHNIVDYEPPHVISIDSFSDDMQHFDKLTLHYYEVDETLVDEREELISNVEDLIGDECLDCFGQDSNDPDIVYVRNERLASDFEIIRLPQSYQETVIGKDE